MRKYWIGLLILSILIGLVGFSTFGCSKPAPQQQVDVQAEKQTYTCPMHPEVVSDEPGKCPICGMNLVPKEEAPKAPSSE